MTGHEEEWTKKYQDIPTNHHSVWTNTQAATPNIHDETDPYNLLQIRNNFPFPNNSGKPARKKATPAGNATMQVKFAHVQ